MFKPRSHLNPKARLIPEEEPGPRAGVWAGGRGAGVWAGGPEQSATVTEVLLLCAAGPLHRSGNPKSAWGEEGHCW